LLILSARAVFADWQALINQWYDLLLCVCGLGLLMLVTLSVMVALRLEKGSTEDADHNEGSRKL